MPWFLKETILPHMNECNSELLNECNSELSSCPIPEFAPQKRDQRRIAVQRTDIPVSPVMEEMAFSTSVSVISI